MLLAASVELSPSLSSQSWVHNADRNRSIFSHKAREEGAGELSELLEAFRDRDLFASQLTTQLGSAWLQPHTHCLTIRYTALLMLTDRM